MDGSSDSRLTTLDAAERVEPPGGEVRLGALGMTEPTAIHAPPPAYRGVAPSPRGPPSEVIANRVRAPL